MQITLYCADCIGVKQNCSYPHKVEVKCTKDMKDAVEKDHVCARYENNRRSEQNFMESDVIAMDIDNDHSNAPEDWITEDKMKELFGSVDFVLVPSRHHMLEKDGLAARPRFHVYFPVPTIKEAEDYKGFKSKLQQSYPFFDGNAIDAARFLFGSDVKETDIVWNDGWMCILDEMDTDTFSDAYDDFDGDTIIGTIAKGNRNNTLSRFAGRVLKRYGDCDKAHEIFLRQADKCDPPLDPTELSTIWFSAVKFFNSKIASNGGYVPPSQYNNDFDTGSLKPDDYSDIGQAKAMIKEYGDELRYSDATDYLRYDGTTWVENKQMAVGAMEEFLDLQLADAQKYVEAAEKSLMAQGIPEDLIKGGGKALDKVISAQQQKYIRILRAAKAYLAFVMMRRDYKYITSALNAAKPMLNVKVTDLDKDELLLNTPAATYDLSKGMNGAHPHRPEDLITKITSVSPSDEGKDLWEDSLQLFFSGDQELIDYFQMVIGMAAIGKVYQEHLVIIVGQGSNGKSTLMNTISRVLGTYSGKLSAETLTIGCRRNVKPEMAELKGKRLIIASELEEGTRLNTAIVKQLCSTDEIYAEKKYKAPFAFIPSHTLVLYTNHLPKVGATDDGIWRRLIVIPFNAKITGSNDIKNYADYLYEHAGGYILQWIINGAKKAIDADFKTTLPKCVQAAINAYREENNWLGHFIQECCETDDSYTEKAGDLYQRYREYSTKNGEYIRQVGDFNAGMEMAGFNRHKTKKGTFFYGLRLKNSDDFL